MSSLSPIERFLPVIVGCKKLPDLSRDSFGDRQIEFEICFDSSRLPRVTGETEREVLQRMAKEIKAEFDREKPQWEKCYAEVSRDFCSILFITQQDVYERVMTRLTPSNKSSSKSL